MSTQRTPKNTRKYRRMTVRILVDYQVGGAFQCDYATTLGAGGMFLQTELALKKGDTMKVRFRVPDGEELHEFQARVTWAHTSSVDPQGNLRTPGVGLQFMDAAATAVLARELEDLAD